MSARTREKAKRSQENDGSKRSSRPEAKRKEKIAVAAAEWSVASAKAKFSEVVASAEASPQTIKRNGKPVAVVVGIDEWQRRTRRKGSLAEFFLNSPLRGSGLDLERSEIEPRDIEL